MARAENLFFSRRVVDPQFGARVTGKLGRWAVAGVVSDDRAPGQRFGADDPGHGQRAFGAVARVPYRALYRFFRSEPGRPW